MGKFSILVFRTQLWIFILLYSLSSKGYSLPVTEESKGLVKMRQQWEECCRSNRTLCIRGSCYSVEWRAAAWAAVRNRCRGRYSDWPFAVDIMKVQEEKDIEALWTLLSMTNAYPNQNSALPITVWTSGTRCPHRGPSGIVVSTKWASNQPFPSWLEEKVNDSSLVNDSSSEESCKFMVISPETNRTVTFLFEDENAKHAAVCEFLFPGKTEWTTRATINTLATTKPYGCEQNTSEVSICNDETNSTLPTTLPSFTDARTDLISTEETSTQTVTPSNFNQTENNSMGDKNDSLTTDISHENKSETITPTKGGEVTSSTYVFSRQTGREITVNHSQITTASDSTISPSDSTTISTYLHTFSSWIQRTTESGTQTSGGVNYIGCKGRNASGIQWPATPPGITANQSCPEGMTGYAQWTCDKKTLNFVPEKPSIHHCRHTWIDKLEDEVHDDVDAVKISATLANKTKDNTLSHGDIAAVVDLAEHLMNLFTKQRNEKEAQEQFHEVSDMTYDFTKSFVATCSNVLRSEHREAWRDLSQVHQRLVATKILRHTEKVGQSLSCIRMTDGTVQYTVLEDNINLQTFMFNSSEKRTIPYVFPQLGPGISSSDRIELPAKFEFDLWPPSCATEKTAVGIVYKNVGQFLSEKKETDSSVDSSVLGFALGNSSARSIKLSKGLKVSILLKHNVPLNRRSARYKLPRCVFWNFSKGSCGNWDDSGCHVEYSNFTYTKCSCDHLTNFAILMDVNNNLGRDDFILDMLTYVCCALSVVGLILTLICLISIRALHCRRSTITSNLCVCLLSMNIILVFGLDRTENETLCASIAGLLQYAVLTAFFWMLLEAYQLYRMVVVVFSSSAQIPMVYLYLFGYGAPLVIVVTSAGIGYEDYGGPDFCWLSNENGLMWSFVGPACFIIMVNIIVFIMTIRSASSVKIKRDQKMADKIRSWVKGSFSILCILGLTWCTGLLYTAKIFYSSAYLFTVLNGLQGIFIFIFHVLLNDKAGSVFRKIFKKKISRQTTRSTFFTGTSSSGHRRAQVNNGSSINNDVRRNSRSLSQQNSRPNSASSNGVPSSISAGISFSQHSRMSSYFASGADTAPKSTHEDGLRKKSSFPGERGVVRQIQRVHYGI